MDKWLEYEGFSMVSEAGEFYGGRRTAGCFRLGGLQADPIPGGASWGSPVPPNDAERLAHGRRPNLRRTNSALFSAKPPKRKPSLAPTRPSCAGRFASRLRWTSDDVTSQGPLARFAADHPALPLEVELSDRVVGLVDEGFDAAIRIGELADSNLISRQLAPCRRVLCAAPAYLDRMGRPSAPSELGQHQQVAYAYSRRNTFRFRVDGQTRHVRVPVAHQANNGAFVRDLALAGLGLALLPTFIASEELASGALETVLDDALDQDIAIYAVYPDRKLLSNKIRRIVSFLAAEYGPRPDLGRPTRAQPGRLNPRPLPRLPRPFFPSRLTRAERPIRALRGSDGRQPSPRHARSPG